MRASRLDLPPPAHAGLALQRYLRQHDDDHSAAKELLNHIAQSQVPEMYQKAFERWRESLKDAVWLEATTKTPLAIGLGNASPIENGLAIHHTYGVPYLPGSALKGLLRRAAEHFGLSEKEKAVLLGEGPDPKGKTPGNAAYLVYWDGWLDPNSAQPFQLDVITVHHPEYYGKKGAVWPTDFDDPNPVAFLSVRPGVKFYLPITCPAQDAQGWPYKAAEVLAWALEHLGLGGKTNAGYGYFACEFGKSAEEEAREREESAKLLESLTSEIEKIQNSGSANKAIQIARQLGDVPPGIRKPTLERLKQQLVSKNLWKEDKEYTKLIDKLLKDIKGGCK
ncbi:CRISPR type III-B/RAMP module RAMP protein Cmr6 [Meiothermus luteus]|jgi:CRISPR-associated protein Cmr6|uniref:CRISPR type III-B/RAMP module RAMP protein Cmr6 n=1 Tax=Meiothermus luteus TaxID=2026184 RepID=A0A399F245_9DEIN|nr:type III-B CRISPR module RAMP protein Cmr6 [Meiothermus luteus]RIH89339.1 CRISPR type III-B/RAMP module RAMP protein Cmr6 [Meiothermus luteus]